MPPPALLPGETGKSPQALQPLVVDTNWDCTAIAPKLKEAGVRVVMRYYTSRAGDSKLLTKNEANAILKNDIALGIVYERGGSNIEFFAQEYADSAATFCIKRDLRQIHHDDQAIRHPDGTVIYFGVEVTDDLEGNFDTIISYFKTIKEKFENANAPYRIGVYGGGYTCARLRAEPLGIEHFWIAGVSTGWPGTKTYYNDADAWHLFQNALEVPLLKPSADTLFDTNLVNPKFADMLGVIHKTGVNDTGEIEMGLMGRIDDSAVWPNLRFVKTGDRALYYVTKDGDLTDHIKTRRDNNHNIIRVDHFNYIEQTRMVYLLEPIQPGDQWAHVEVTFFDENVGKVYQGFVHADRLAHIDKIP
jgi:hypothetical protein